MSDTYDQTNIALNSMAQDINEKYHSAQSHAMKAVERAVECGEALITAKGLVAHGEWAGWLTGNTAVSERTARSWMLLAREVPKLDGAKRQRVADLSLRQALIEVADVQQDVIDPAIFDDRRNWRANLPLKLRRELKDAVQRFAMTHIDGTFRRPVDDLEWHCINQFGPALESRDADEVRKAVQCYIDASHSAGYLYISHDAEQRRLEKLWGDNYTGSQQW